MNKHKSLYTNYKVSPQLESNARNVFVYYNRCLNKSLQLQLLTHPKERKIFDIVKNKADELFKELQSRHDNPEFTYSDGRIISDHDRMRIRMFIGTLKTFYTNYNQIIQNTRCGVMYSLNSCKLNTDVINYIIGFL